MKNMVELTQKAVKANLQGRISRAYREMMDRSTFDMSRILVGQIWKAGEGRTSGSYAPGMLSQKTCDEFMETAPALCLQHDPDVVVGHFLKLFVEPTQIIGIAELPYWGVEPLERTWLDIRNGKLQCFSVAGGDTVEVGDRRISWGWLREVSLVQFPEADVGRFQVIMGGKIIDCHPHNRYFRQ